MQGLILEMVLDLSDVLIKLLVHHMADRTLRDVLIEFGNVSPIHILAHT